MKTSIMFGAIAAGMLLFSALLVGITSSAGVYSPWYDLDDDGDIDIFDIVRIAGSYGTSGEPYPAEAALEYDSGWIDITDKAGQAFTVTHNLHITDWDRTNVVVEITGKTAMDGDLLRLGLTNYTRQQTYGGIGYEGAKSVVQTGDGGYALAGWTFPLGAPARSDFWLVKTDVSGNMQWNKTYGGTDDDLAWALVQTSDGGYALAGETESFGPDFTDFWLVKTDSSGNHLWSKTYGGANSDSASALVQTGDGGYALAGTTTSFGAGGPDVWLVKTDSAGNHLWNKTYGGTNSDYASALVQTSDDGYALAGRTISLGAGGSDFWLVKTDASGNHLWNHTYGGEYMDWAWALVRTGDGGYALAGFTESFGAGGADFWLVKADSAGNHLWNKTYGGTDDDLAWALVQTSDGGYALAGETESFGSGLWDIWLVKTDSSGNHLWSKTYGGTSHEELGALVQTGDGGYALAGTTTSFGAGGSDFWLVRVDLSVNGLSWTDYTADTISLHRAATDTYWNYVCVRVWAIKETP